ncbi:hypothetical protein BDV96DRAFT_644879 [Lophiotrema nucula]|uniref:Methyltransferase type 11 domain-containing protein n=1 Tax=Lophiotrema nucula TaxID=690887 RepID=A0A6A5ZEU9_9PLEO|nr:hypothetical protein BDV96DRAFT_644879 [Lophiotrema nucula]
MATQGFDGKTFDVVVINSSLERANDTAIIMQRIHALLRPSGKLIVRNTAHNAFTAEFALRLLPEYRSWWTSTDQTKKYFVPAVDWRETMESSQLWENIFALHDCHDVKSGFLGCLVATASTPSTVTRLETKFGIITGTASEYHSRPVQSLASNMPDLTPILLALDDAVDANSYPNAFYTCMVEVGAPFLPHLSEASFKQLKTIMAAASGILWVTNGGGESATEPGYHMIDGLARTLRTENPNVPFVTLHLKRTGQKNLA